MSVVQAILIALVAAVSRSEGDWLEIGRAHV